MLWSADNGMGKRYDDSGNSVSPHRKAGRYSSGREWSNTGDGCPAMGLEDQSLSRIDDIALSVSDYFRGPGHLEILEKVIRERSDEGQRRFRVWDAACGEGLRTWRIAVTFAGLPDNCSDYSLLSTYTDPFSLGMAPIGIIGAGEASRLPGLLLNEYFLPLTHRGLKAYKAKESLRSRLRFRRLDLRQTPYGIHETFDAVFLPRLDDQFHPSVTEKILVELHRLIPSGGLLFHDGPGKLDLAYLLFESTGDGVYMRP